MIFEDDLAFPTPTNVADQIAQVVVLVGTGAAVVVAFAFVAVAALGWL